jgi:cell division protein FtsB
VDKARIQLAIAFIANTRLARRNAKLERENDILRSHNDLLSRQVGEMFLANKSRREARESEALFDMSHEIDDRSVSAG